ncbi:MAG: MBL fold metallo-hydrolase, partial [Syntrophobacteraceae bacterium]|nr:MBL fold metallo-hydrolase [Syntrophobacteraceae bacterium]
MIKDSESATHGDDAASHKVVDTYKFPGFKVIQFNLAVLSHYSYMLISENQAIVVDPGRDVFAYLDMAKKEGATIKGVFLTHSHADFVAGHAELAKMAGCPIFKIATGGAQFTYKALKEGDTLEVGNALMKFVETPGHTPDGLCGFVHSKSEPADVQVIFTGDTLFVGSVGRPDLLEGTMSAATLASMSFDTWTNKLSKVNDSAVILPAHGAGSLCGAHLSDSPSSTIGAEKASNHYLKYKNRAEYIAAVLEGLPEAPQYFKHNAAMNRKGPELVEWKAPLGPEATPDKALMDPSRVYVADIRDAVAYARGHIPNSVNIGVRGRFES